MKKPLSWLIIIVSGLLVFSPSFLTAMHGDEWKVIWLARNALEVNGNYFPIHSWDVPYLFEIITLDLMSRFFPLYSGMFYLAAFGLRLLATLLIYKLCIKLTNQKLSA